MEKHISFPSIEQYRNVVKTVRDRSSHHSVPLPKITFTGTVKLHGANAAVCAYFDTECGYTDIWAQSRSQLITPEADNYGFAKYVQSNKEAFQNLMTYIRMYFDVFANSTLNGDEIISVYGEWCGQGIQQGVGISQLPKMFVIFAIAIVEPANEFGEQTYRWMTRDTIESVYGKHIKHLPDSPIKCIYDFQTWEIEIDFVHPDLSQNQLGKITEAVELCCPVANAIAGIDGVGEGVVWRASSCSDPNFRIDDLVFKVKGEKHSVSKVKTLASVDVEKVNSISEFVNKVLTESRLQQGISFLTETGLPIDNVSTGPFLKWIGNDVLKEETDTLEESGLERKDVMAVLNREARNWFLKQIV